MATSISSSTDSPDAADNLPGPSSLARTLGLAGLLPFIAGAFAVWLLGPGARGLAATALLAYGAVIVSFLGGIHWGLAMRSAQAATLQLVWGVSPSLLAWLALVLQARWGLLLTAVSLAACYVVDQLLYRRSGLGAWLRLRARLTLVASISCLAGAVALSVR